jgi:hypothetical protein
MISRRVMLSSSLRRGLGFLAIRERNQGPEVQI